MMVAIVVAGACASESSSSAVDGETDAERERRYEVEAQRLGADITPGFCDAVRDHEAVLTDFQSDDIEAQADTWAALVPHATGDDLRAIVVDSRDALRDAAKGPPTGGETSVDGASLQMAVLEECGLAINTPNILVMDLREDD